MNRSDSAEIEISGPTSANHATILEETNAFCAEWNQQKSTPVKRSLSGMDTEVFKAAREGNIVALREHSDLHQKLTPTKNTVLHIYIACVGSARLTQSKELLKSAGVVREMLKMCQRLLLQPNESGDTALHLAARYGRADIVGVLIQAAKDWHGDLEEGISSNEVLYQFLIRRPNEEKNTALHEAVRFNHLDVVKILTEEDPEFLYSANDAGQTPLYMAAERGYQDLVIEMLGTWSNPSYQGPDGLTALHVAAAYGHSEITRRLLQKEMTLAIAAERNGNTPLHMAALRGHVLPVKQILEFDKSPAYIGNIYEMTPVHLAACSGSVGVLEQLIFDCPDSFELVDHKGRNALHLAIINNEDKVEEFVRKDPWLSSVLLNGKDCVGNTPLHQIATSQQYDGLDFVSDYRVDKMAVNKENMNAVDIILQNVQKKEKDSILQFTTAGWMYNLLRGLQKSGASAGERLPRDYGDGSQVKIDLENRYKEVKKSHLIMCTLIATVTFAAGFTVPGGYQNEKGPDQGFAVLSKNAAFQAFVITNTLAMTMSSCAIMIRFFLSLKGKRHGSQSFDVALGLTNAALISMVVAFLTGTYAVLGHHSSLGLAIGICGIACYFVVHGFLFTSPRYLGSRSHSYKCNHRTLFRLWKYYFFY